MLVYQNASLLSGLALEPVLGTAPASLDPAVGPMKQALRETAGAAGWGHAR